MGVRDDLKKMAEGQNKSGSGSAIDPYKRPRGRPRKDEPKPDPLLQMIAQTVTRVQEKVRAVNTGPKPIRSADGKILGAGKPEKPKPLVDMIRAVTNNGEELVMFHSSVFHGELEIEETRHTKDGDEYTFVGKPTVKERQASAEWLANRLWGKAPEIVKVEKDVHVSATLDVTKMTLEQMDALALLMKGTEAKNETVDGEITEGEIVSGDLPRTDSPAMLPADATVIAEGSSE